MVCVYIYDPPLQQELETRAFEPGLLQVGPALEHGRQTSILKWWSPACPPPVRSKLHGRMSKLRSWPKTCVEDC